MFLTTEQYESVKKVIEAYKQVTEIQDQLSEVKDKIITNQQVQIECLERLLDLTEQKVALIEKEPA
jgi:L-lactate utilization protein LutB